MNSEIVTGFLMFGFLGFAVFIGMLLNRHRS